MTDSDKTAKGRAKPRWRVPVIVLSVAVLSGVAGVLAAGQLQPAAPEVNNVGNQQPVTAPVERKVLESSIVTRGDLGYGEPVTVRLAGGVHTAESGTNLLVTRQARPDAPVTAGSVLLEVSGRPVFVLPGALPMYRALGQGAQGADVKQLEEALKAAGIDPGTIDGVYDGALQQAVARMYSAKGYDAPAPTEDAAGLIRSRQAALDQAQGAVTDARVAYQAALAASHGSAHLDLESALAAAQSQQSQTQTEVVRADADAHIATVSAQSAQQRAEATLAQARLTGRDPADEKLTCGQSCLQALQQAADEAALRASAAVNDETNVAAEGRAKLAQAQLDVDAAQARLAEALDDPTVAAAARALSSAQAALAQDRADLNDAVIRGRAVIPSGELVFMPRLPMTVREVKANVGDAATGDLAILASDQRVVRATVPLGDLRDVKPGMLARLDSGEGSAPIDARVISAVQAPASTDGAEPVGQLLVDASAVRPTVLAGQSLRVVLPLHSTQSMVLVVPLTAVNATAADDAFVTVIQAGAATRRVDVTVGLSADGQVEVTPTNGSLSPGDRVAVGG